MKQIIVNAMNNITARAGELLDHATANTCLIEDTVGAKKQILYFEHSFDKNINFIQTL